MYQRNNAVNGDQAGCNCKAPETWPKALANEIAEANFLWLRHCQGQTHFYKCVNCNKEIKTSTVYVKSPLLRHLKNEHSTLFEDENAERDPCVSPTRRPTVKLDLLDCLAIQSSVNFCPIETLVENRPENMLIWGIRAATGNTSFKMPEPRLVASRQVEIETWLIEERSSLLASAVGFSLLVDVWCSGTGYAFLGLNAEFMDHNMSRKRFTVDHLYFSGCHSVESMANCFRDSVSTMLSNLAPYESDPLLLKTTVDTIASLKKIEKELTLEFKRGDVSVNSQEAQSFECVAEERSESPQRDREVKEAVRNGDRECEALRACEGLADPSYVALLGLREAMKRSAAAGNVIAKNQSIVKFLRSQPMWMIALRHAGVPRSLLDSEVRWTTKHALLELGKSLLPVVNCLLTTNPTLPRLQEKITDTDIRQTEALYNVLQLFVDLIMNLEAPDAHCGIIGVAVRHTVAALRDDTDFLKGEFRYLRNDIADSLSRRFQSHLGDNYILLASYLDPRLRDLSTLTHEEAKVLFRNLPEEICGRINFYGRAPSSEPATPNCDRSLKIQSLRLSTVSAPVNLMEQELLKYASLLAPMEEPVLPQHGDLIRASFGLCEATYQWWRRHRGMFPILFRYAQLLFSISLSGAEIERVLATPAYEDAVRRRSRSPEKLRRDVLLARNFTYLQRDNALPGSLAGMNENNWTYNV